MVVSSAQKYRRLAPAPPGEEDQERQRERDVDIFSGADGSVWQQDPRKYAIAQTYESQAMCSVVVASKIKLL